MIKICKLLIVFGLLSAVLNASAQTANSGLPPLIPRDVLLGNPSKSRVQISPDGQWLAYIAPSKQGVLNVWIQDIKQIHPPQIITNDTHRGIQQISWTKDSQQILYTQDLNGNENWHVYSVNLKNNFVRDLTPFQGIRAQGILQDQKFPTQILVGLNIRDRHVFDMYRIDLKTGAVTLDTLNPGDVNDWLADANFQIRAALANNPDGSTTLRVRDNINASWHDVIHWPFGEQGNAVSFNQDGKILYITSSLNSDTSQLLAIDPKNGNIIKVLAHNPKSDVAEILVNDNNHQIQAVQFNYLKPEKKVLDPSIQADFSKLAATGKGEFSLLNRDTQDHTWIVAFHSDVDPGSYYIYDRATQQLKYLFAIQPVLQKYILSHMQPFLIKARDGMDLVSYLTLPASKTTTNLPMVLYVHGGPWTRDDWGFDPEVQWLANRGYAVLQVNFRGSTGLGKKYLNAGNAQWGTGAMQNDLTDAVNWANKQKIANPKKVCIYGASYGGYATLAGLSFTPELYTCGIDVVGPTNLKTLVATIPPYWEPEKKEMLLRIGDVENSDVFNRKISPLFHANNIRAPLLIVQGANDPRVNISQADTIVKAMRDKKIPVTYIVYTDEGHGFARPENRLDFAGRAEEFLAKYLGGRAQPWERISNSTAEVR